MFSGTQWYPMLYLTKNWFKWYPMFSHLVMNYGQMTLDESIGYPHHWHELPHVFFWLFTEVTEGWRPNVVNSTINLRCISIYIEKYNMTYVLHIMTYIYIYIVLNTIPICQLLVNTWVWWWLCHNFTSVLHVRNPLWLMIITRWPRQIEILDIQRA